MSKHGKSYNVVEAQLDREKLYDPTEAIEIFKNHPIAKFDETFELHLRMGVDPRHADQMVRGVIVMPRGTGKDSSHPGFR